MVVIGQRNVNAPQQATAAPLPNMNFSHIANQNNAGYQPAAAEPAYRNGNYGNYVATQTPDYSRPTAGFNFNVNRGTQNFQNGSSQPTPASYVIPGRFTAADQMRVNNQGTYVSPNYANIQRIRAEQMQNQGTYIAPARVTANDRINENTQRNAPAPENTTIENARSQAAAYESARTSRAQSNPEPAARSESASYSRPSYSTPSSSSSSSSSSSTGHK